MDLIAALGLIFCHIMVATGFRSLAPSVCFGGDTSMLGLEALIVVVMLIVAGSALGYRAAGSSSVVMIVVAMSVLAAGSAAIVHYVDY